MSPGVAQADSASNPAATARSARAWYRRVWRWHFYAGLVTLPFVFMLATTGMIYLFKPQIDAWQEKPFDHLTLQTPAHSLDDQVAAARRALPDARLKALELTADPSDAARVLMMRPDGETLRVYVRPDTLDILRTVPENDRISKVIRTIHGELLAGESGAIFVEMIGAWGIVMFLTGLYLWWPQSTSGLGGVLYPRWGGGRRFLRDLHAVTGFWVSVLALFFLLSALPWTKVFGGGLKQIEAALGKDIQHRDWTTGPASEHAEHMHAFAQSAPAAHEMNSDRPPGAAHAVTFDVIAGLVRPLGLADPILVSRPTNREPNWIVRSDAQNRPRRVTLEFDPHSGQMVTRHDFADQPLIDRIVGVGVAAHEGQLFGWINQALGVLTAVSLLVMTVSAFLMWRRRRPSHTLGAPPLSPGRLRLAPAVGALVIVLACLLPTLGVSLLLVITLERAVRKWFPAAGEWLGLV